jgi:dolichol-phosphate mannosyltransferase
MNLFVLLPAYNEELALPLLVPRIVRAASSLPHRLRMILVDDGSTDGTAAAARALQADHPLEVLTHPLNRGLGETIRDGIEHCVRQGRPGDVIVRMDCDDTQDPGAIPALVEKLAAGHDVAITSRYLPGAGQRGVYGHRRLLSWAAGLCMKAAFPIAGVRDYSCGYRAYRWEILARALRVFGDRFIEQRHLGFSCTVEKLVKLRMLGARFAEVPHVLRYDLKKGPSKMAGRPTLLGYLLLTARYSPWLGLSTSRWRRRILDASPAVPRDLAWENPPCAASSAG